MPANYNVIKEIAGDFVSQTYKNDIPNGYCFSLCYPLSVLFTLMDIQHEITFGKALQKQIELSHFWITLDGNRTILDATIKQFNPNESPVFLGDIRENETTKKYKIIERTDHDTFAQTHDSWAEPLFHQEHRRPFPPDLEIKLISFNLTAANVLISYIRTFGLKDKLLSSAYGLQYFQPIRFYLKNHHTTGMACKDEIIRLG
jgi:hypothetical protein